MRIHRHWLFLGGFAILLTLSLVPTLCQESEASEWVVDEKGTGNFTTLSDALNASEIEDSILVKAGNYILDLDQLKRNISIKGEGAEFTRLTLAKEEWAIQEMRSNINVTGVNISAREDFEEPGLLFSASKDTLLFSNCTFSGFRWGLQFVANQDDIIFRDNSLWNSPIAATNSFPSFSVEGFHNNSYNGKPLGILANQQNLVFEGLTHGFYLVNCSNVSINDPELEGPGIGIYLERCDNVSISRARVVKQRVRLSYSSRIRFQDCVFTHTPERFFYPAIQTIGTNGLQFLNNSFSLNWVGNAYEGYDNILWSWFDEDVLFSENQVDDGLLRF